MRFIYTVPDRDSKSPTRIQLRWSPAGDRNLIRAQRKSFLCLYSKPINQTMSKPILDNLFGSKIRVKILKFLYRNHPDDFSIGELARRIQESLADTKQEVELLRQIKVVVKKK